MILKHIPSGFLVIFNTADHVKNATSNSAPSSISSHGEDSKK